MYFLIKFKNFFVTLHLIPCHPSYRLSYMRLAFTAW